MEQGRVNDAARVGQSADLVVAPLFLLCFFFFSQLLLLWFFLVYELDFRRDSSTFLFFLFIRFGCHLFSMA